MRIGCCLHDRVPSVVTHTQQVVWTLVEVARLGVSVELMVPDLRIPPGAGRVTALADWYGVPADLVPETLAVGEIPCPRTPLWLSRAVFDRRVPAHFRQQPVDVVWTRNMGAALWCARAGLPTIFETYRPDIAAAARFAVWRRQVLRSPHLRAVIVHSQIAARAFLEAGVPASRMLVARNGHAPSLMQPRLGIAEARARLGLEIEGPLVVYAGHAHRRKGIAVIIRLAAAVPDARFLILGFDPGGEWRFIERAAREAGVRNLLLRPRVRPADVAPYLFAADCLIVPPTGEPLRRSRTVLPLKSYTYLAAGRAILAPRLPDIEEVLVDGENARLVSPNDDAATVSALRGLLSDGALRDRLSRRALAAAAQYTWAHRARTIVSFLNRDR